MQIGKKNSQKNFKKFYKILINNWKLILIKEKENLIIWQREIS